jgi:hypothetical protein
MKKTLFNLDLQPGSIVIANSYDLQNDPRMLFVTYLDKEYGYLEACLVSERVDLATDYDIKLTSEYTGLPYDLAVQSKLIINMFSTQVSKVVSELDNNVSSQLISLIDNIDRGQEAESKIFEFGLTINSRKDMKEFKDQESLVAMQFGIDCYLSLSNGIMRVVPTSQLQNPSFINDIQSLDMDSIYLAGDYMNEATINPDTYNAFSGLVNAQLQQNKDMDFSSATDKEEIQKILYSKEISGWIIDFEGKREQKKIYSFTGKNKKMQITLQERVSA